MLSDEEKKAIERLNIYKEKIKDELYPILDFEEEKAIGVVLNLIEKQQKEIEEIKKYEKYYEEMEEVNKKFISVDKIKAKIEEYKESGSVDGTNDILITEMQSLLEKE